jgi:hypothetical protein
MVDADALVEVNCAIAVGAAPKLKWLHANSGGGDTCLTVPAVWAMYSRWPDRST